jgi:hypothetical protein
MAPTRHQFTVLKQLCDLLPPHLVPKLAREHGVEDKSRAITPWSHTVSLMFAQISHALSLNDVCDTLENHGGVLTTIRHAAPPSRNGLSHATQERNADMAEALSWETLAHLQGCWPQFGMGRKYVGFPPAVQEADHQCCGLDDDRMPRRLAAFVPASSPGRSWSLTRRMMLRPLRLAGTLWDSRATAPLPRRTGTGLPAELEPLLTCGTATGQAKENAKWVATENPATKLWNSANPRGFYPLWDGSEPENKLRENTRFSAN